MLLLGVDVGTTGAKAIVFDEKGNQKGYGFKEYGVICKRPGLAEQDAETVWSITKGVIKQAVQKSGPDIAALSISVQGDAVIPIDRNRNALGLAHLGMDYRGVRESKMCEEKFGGRWLFNQTGMRPHPLNSLIKILWIKNNEPRLYEKTWKFVTYADYIMAKLGSDDIVIDYPMASRTMALDIHSLAWSDEILSGLDISKEKLASPVKSAEVVGHISAGIAEELGINPNALIVTGGHDQTCAALGAGIVEENMALDSHGTAEVVSTAFNSPRLDHTMYNSYYPCYLHTVPNMFFTFSLNHIGGILLKWFVEGFCHKEIREAQEKGVSHYELVLSKAAAGPSPVMVIPHFNGSGTPTCDLDAKGAILGLTMATTRHDIAKAIIESLSYEMRLNIETMPSAGIDIKQLRCVGGGARSAIGLQSKADITGLPISTLKIREAACLGAAMLAGIAAGIYRDVPDAVQIVELADAYYPEKAAQENYNSKYHVYLKAYEEIRELSYRL